jgi:hypothetical protein
MHWHLQSDAAQPHVSFVPQLAGRGSHAVVTVVSSQQPPGGGVVPFGQMPPSPGRMQAPPDVVWTTQTSPATQPPHSSDASDLVTPESRDTPASMMHAQPSPSLTQVRVAELHVHT